MCSGSTVHDALLRASFLKRPLPRSTVDDNLPWKLLADVCEEQLVVQRACERFSWYAIDELQSGQQQHQLVQVISSCRRPVT
jgi:hypothetical protein